MRQVFVSAAATLVVLLALTPSVNAQQMPAPSSQWAHGADAGGYVGVTLQQLMLALGVALQGGKAMAQDVNLARRMRPGADEDEGDEATAMVIDPPRSPSLAVLPHPAQ